MIAVSARSHARAVRARLWRPPNAVPDRGFSLGKAEASALAEREEEKRQIAAFVALEDERSRAKASVTIDIVTSEVAKYYGIETAILCSCNGSSRHGRPRNVAIYLSKKMVRGITYEAISLRFGLSRDVAYSRAIDVRQQALQYPETARAIVEISEAIIARVGA